MKKNCWREKGCPFDSKTSLKYLKCLQDRYSVAQCERDCKEYWNKIDFKKEVVLKEMKFIPFAYFDGTENEYCLMCYSRNEPDSLICKNCGSTSFIFGFGVVPIEDNKGRYRCECGGDLELSRNIGSAYVPPVYEVYSECKCGNIWGSQIKIKLSETLKNKRGEM